MPGSMLNAWPGFERLPVARHEVRLFVGLEPDAVAGAVDEPLAEPTGGDHPPGGRVDLLARRPDRRGLHRLLLRVDEQRVDVRTSALGSPTTNMRVMSA